MCQPYSIRLCKAHFAFLFSLAILSNIPLYLSYCSLYASVSISTITIVFVSHKFTNCVCVWMFFFLSLLFSFVIQCFMLTGFFHPALAIFMCFFPQFVSSFHVAVVIYVCVLFSVLLEFSSVVVAFVVRTKSLVLLTNAKMCIRRKTEIGEKYIKWVGRRATLKWKIEWKWRE